MKVIFEAVEAGVHLFPGFQPFADYYFDVAGYSKVQSARGNAMFIAQMAHETMKFTRFEENLNYTKNRLITVWPSRFRLGKRSEPTDASGRYKDGKINAWEIGSQPEKIANAVYADRMGNGGVQSGDGWKFRGRGPFMLTGKGNYQEFQDEIMWRFPDVGNVVEEPDLLFDPEIGLWTAGWFWSKNNIGKYGDAGNVMGATRKINGGQVGIEERNKLYHLVLDQFSTFK